MTQDQGADPLEVVVVQRVDGFKAALRRQRDGSLVLEGLEGQPLPTLEPGERLKVTRPVAGDATYVQPARVLRVRGDDEDPGVVIRAGGEAERDQQRQFVRVPTPPIDVLVLTSGGEDAPGSLRDLSAGGVRAILEAEGLDVGTRVRISFDLPREGAAGGSLDLRGEVVWAGEVGDGFPAVGIQFSSTDSATEKRITRWVFKQESKRLR